MKYTKFITPLLIIGAFKFSYSDTLVFNSYDCIDSYVDKDQPNTNFGNSDIINVDS